MQFSPIYFQSVAICVTYCVFQWYVFEAVKMTQFFGVKKMPEKCDLRKKRDAEKCDLPKKK